VVLRELHGDVEKDAPLLDLDLSCYRLPLHLRE
jgi:hypothetical protein